MTKRMLIDATHTEETRVTVVSGNRLEEFDYETATRQQVKGNIYLAKVTRVEPSLQAAFVEYGGNRHGFLAFSEIHPDYYRIPVSDRDELVEDDSSSDDDDAENADGDGVEELGAGGGVDEAVEEAAKRRPRLRRQYKIQEVIKRRQVMLIQVVKEERGNKGAALTTYLSLAGRYCVVMPNTSRGGGVSRKIANAQDRKRLKAILADLSVPEGMAVILRTAGAERSKAEVKRDFDYLMKLWDEIRKLTLESTAPFLIHEEGSLVKRAIRDVYTKDIEEVLVAGDNGYRVAKDFMKRLIPSHAKKVQPYKDDQGIPLFHRYQVEQQLAQMYDATVQLRSGGSIVIHQTEALVAIDVNSGKATRERHIEETAVKTNLEAADEIARQLRLRDLAGLIVIDFIDMDENRNGHAVERRLKEALRRDRARIQVGRISGFGLLEMSRQRLRPSLLEAMSQPCPTCGGVGYIVSTESAALMVTRAIEEECLKGRASELTVRVPGSVALYVLNHKRAVLADIEVRYGITIVVEAVDGMLPPRFEILRNGMVDQASEPVQAKAPPRPTDSGEEENKGRRNRRGGRRRGRRDDRDERIDEDQDSDVKDTDQTNDPSVSPTQGSEEDEERGRKRRRRGRRGGRRRRGRDDEATQESPSDEDKTETTEDGTDQSVESGAPAQSADESGPESHDVAESQSTAADSIGGDSPVEQSSSEETADQSAQPNAPSDDEEAAPKPAKKTAKRSRARKKAAAAKPEPAASADEVVADTSETQDSEEKAPAPAKKPRRTRKKAAAAKPATKKAKPVDGEGANDEPSPPAEAQSAAEPETAVSSVSSEATQAPPHTSEPAQEAPAAAQVEQPDPTPEEPPKPKKKGWWNRMVGS